MRGLLTAVVAASGAAALQIPLQLPLDVPWFSSSPSPSSSSVASSDAADSSSKPLVNSKELQATIKGKNLMKRAEELYKFAQKSEDQYNHPTRVIGSQGHLATLAHISYSLLNLGGYYTVSNQHFPAIVGNIFQSRLILGNDVLTSAAPMALTPPTYNNEPIHGDLVHVKGGCAISDYAAVPTGSIVLVQRGECSFGEKSALAGRAGAAAALIYNDGEDVLRGTLGDPRPEHVATFGLSGPDGEKYAKMLENGESVDVIAYLDSEVQRIRTTNIIAQTVQGDPDNCIMLGAHSDGVEEGPGINDDGSGSLSLLEIATQLSHFSVNNCVRLAWWAAEEEGLVGSDYYVAQLSRAENKKIRVFMDYDMMASPNFAYQVYDANNEDHPNGSYELKKLYTDWYEEQGLNFTYIPFDGRSDYDAFIRNGIPGGGIATGAEGVKTEEEEGMFGGESGEWYDPCYHQLCDDTSNLNVTAWEVNTKLIAHALATYATSLEAFPERTDDFVASSRVKPSKYHGPKLVM